MYIRFDGPQPTTQGPGLFSLAVREVDYNLNQMRTGLKLTEMGGAIVLVQPTHEAALRGLQLKGGTHIVRPGHEEIVVSFEPTYGREWNDGEELLTMVVFEPQRVFLEREGDHA